MTVSGTEPYQAPDADYTNWDVSTDLFAAGVVLYELLCGEHPYEDDRPRIDAFPRRSTSVQKRPLRRDGGVPDESLCAGSRASLPERTRDARCTGSYEPDHERLDSAVSWPSACWLRAAAPKRSVLSSKPNPRWQPISWACCSRLWGETTSHAICLTSYCVAEEIVQAGRLDLRFRAGTWDLIIELKIHAGYGRGWFERYLSELSDGQHAHLAAITRDVPIGEPPAGVPAKWLGATRWRSLLKGMHDLVQQCDIQAGGRPPGCLKTRGFDGIHATTARAVRYFWDDGGADAREGPLQARYGSVLRSCRQHVGEVRTAPTSSSRGAGNSRTRSGAEIDIPFQGACERGRSRPRRLDRLGLPAWLRCPTSGHAGGDTKMSSFPEDVQRAANFLIAHGFDPKYMRE